MNGLSRDDFSEVYLFFDYDGHQNNLGSEDADNDILEEMLQNFDNETENGKLYVSYPMVESLRDFIPEQCATFTDCFWKISEFCKYKNISGIYSQYVQMNKYNFEIWTMILNVFAMRISCMMEENTVISHDEYEEKISPYVIYKMQKKYIDQDKIFILSAFPEFLLDYFRVGFWKSNIKYKRLRNEGCRFHR